MDRSPLLGSPLARRLTTYVVLLSLFVTLVGTALQLYLSYRQNMRQIADGFELIEASYLGSLVDNVWVYNDKQVGIQLDGLLGLPGVEHVYINIDDQIVWSSGDIRAGSTVEKTFDLIHQEGNRQQSLGTLSVIVGLDQVYNELLSYAGVALLISAVMVSLVAGSLLLIFRNLVTRHMTTIAHFVNTLDIGPEGASLRLNRKSSPGKREDEFDLVVDAINKMRRNLLLSIQDLRKSEEHIQTLFQAADNVAFVTTDLGGKNALVQGFSPGAEKMFGFTAREIIGQEVAILLSPAAAAQISVLRQQIQEGSVEYSRETMLTRKSGECFPALFTIKPLLDGSGTLIGTIGVTLDITEQKQIEKELEAHRDHLEELVEKRTAELKEKTDSVEESRKALTYLLEDVNEAREELQQVNVEYVAANKELKEFAYIVSHDLKAPLRAISQLTHWISEDYSEVFDADAREQMGLIVNRVKRMDSLIDGVLRYSRVGRIKEKEEELDLNVLVKEVIAAIAVPDTIQIRIETPLPVIFRDPTRMEQVFQNLIENAVKYMDKAEGCIQLECADKDAFWEFSVSDNGPGIAKRYHEKVFQIFQTLTPRDERESTGIGLTLVKKIITLYGGLVWVESEEGQGATFFFTLPKKGELDEKL